jgi:hypothetical protein
MIELVMWTRDAKGNPIGRKEFAAESGAEISDFYLRTVGKPKKKKKQPKEDTTKK